MVPSKLKRHLWKNLLPAKILNTLKEVHKNTESMNDMKKTLSRSMRVMFFVPTGGEVTCGGALSYGWLQ